MVAGRPRRSAAPDSYRIAFPELTSSGSDDSESGEESGAEGQEQGAQADEGGPTADGSAIDASLAVSDGAIVKKKKKKKRKEPSPSPDAEPDSASGSEFELEVIKNKDGTVVEVADEDDDEEFEEDVVEESESGDSAAGEKDLDNISIANSEGLESGSEAGTGKQGIKHGKTRYFFAGHPSEDGKKTTSSGGPPPIRIVGRALSTTAPALAAPSRKSALRTKMQSHLMSTQKMLGLHELTWGPTFWPPPFTLSKGFDDPAHSPVQSQDAEQQGLETLAPLSEAERLFHLKRLAYLPFGPVPGICLDVGWYKGKWARDAQDVIQRAVRWGGWYESVKTNTASFEFIQNIQ